MCRTNTIEIRNCQFTLVYSPLAKNNVSFTESQFLPNHIRWRTPSPNLERFWIQVFKAKLDDRYLANRVVSHSEMSLPAEIVDSAQEVLALLDDRTEVVAIDEVQFFDNDIVEVCEKLANMGKRVIAAGLDQDYRGVPFEPIPQLMAVAEYVTKALAVCVRCGAPANRTQRMVDSDQRILVGAADSYEARCRRCFEPDLARQMSIPLVDTQAKEQEKA